MSGRWKISLLLAAVVLMICIPLLIVKAPAPGANGGQAALFTGTDNQAAGVIQKLHPDYQPWFDFQLKPPSSEIESLLFALQAALGAGVIGYYVGYMRGKKRGALPAPNVADRAH